MTDSVERLSPPPRQYSLSLHQPATLVYLLQIYYYLTPYTTGRLTIKLYDRLHYKLNRPIDVDSLARFGEASRFVLLIL